MKDAINYLKYKDYLIKHCKQVISNFSKTNENKDVYTFVLDAQSDYGTVLIRWNSYDGLKKTLQQECYKSKTNDQIYAHNGLKYSVGDFCYEDSAIHPQIEKFERKYYDFMEEASEDEHEHNRNQFMTALVEVLLAIKPSFESLHKADEFISYVVDHDEDDFMYIRKTVAEDEFYKAFPELRVEAIY